MFLEDLSQLSGTFMSKYQTMHNMAQPLASMLLYCLLLLFFRCVRDVEHETLERLNRLLALGKESIVIFLQVLRVVETNPYFGGKGVLLHYIYSEVQA